MTPQTATPDTPVAKPATPPTPIAPSGAGLRVPRRFTRAGVNPFDEVQWDRRRTVISNPDGSIVFKMENVEVPADWSQLATDIVVSKYFRKAGLPTEPGHEHSVRQVVHRLAHTIRRVGSCPRTKAGKATEAVIDFRFRGGTVMISLRISRRRQRSS